MTDIVLGIHSNVKVGDIDPNTGRPYGIDAGHSWLSVTNEGETKNYGLWPDANPQIARRGLSNGDGSDIRVGIEDSYVAEESRYFKITPEQLQSFEKKLTENVHWHVNNNCASWATETLRDVTGIQIKADDWAPTVETPRIVGDSIHKLEAVEPTSELKPATPAPVTNRKIESSDANDVINDSPRYAAVEFNQPLAANASVQEVGNYTLAALLLDDDDAMHAALDKAFATDVAKDTMQNAQQAVIAYDNEQAKIQQIESPVRVMRMG